MPARLPMPPNDLHNVKLWMRQLQEDLAEIVVRIDQSRQAAPDLIGEVRALQDEADAAYKDFARQGGHATEADQNEALQTFRRLDERLAPLKRQWLP